MRLINRPVKIYLPLRRGREPDGNRLLKADFHGAIMTVVRSTIPTTIGVRGILLQETYRSFKIITEANKLISAFSLSMHVSFAFLFFSSSCLLIHVFKLH